MFETIDIIREEVFKLFYFLFFVVVVDDIIVYFPNPIDSSQNYLEISKGLGGNNGHTINIKIKNHMQCGRLGFDPCVGMIPCRRERLPTPVFCAAPTLSVLHHIILQNSVIYKLV